MKRNTSKLSEDAKSCLDILFNLRECNDLNERAVSKIQVFGMTLNDGNWKAGIEELLSRDIITDTNEKYLINISIAEYS
jgi:hypothetical protein